MSVKREQFDVAVIGAGPAGSSAAISLARLGIRVALIEAGVFPQNRLCGEFLSPECGTLLQSLGVMDRVRSLMPAPVRTVRMTAADGEDWTMTLPEPGWGLTRRALDATLAQAAVSHGASLLERTSVTGITGDLEHGFCVQTLSGSSSSELRAQAVIVATGKRSPLDRVLNRPFMRQSQPFVALNRHFDGPELEKRVELHGFPGGYCGLAQVEGGQANVCLLVREHIFREASRAATNPIQAFFEWMQGQNRNLETWFGAATPIDDRWTSIAQVPFGNKSPTLGDLLMVGDASELIAPLAGNGIAIALHSGAMAAYHCGEFLEGRTSAAELPVRYAKAWRQEFGKRLGLARVLQGFMLRPRLISPALRVVRAAPSFGTWLLVNTRNLLPAAGLPPYRTDR